VISSRNLSEIWIIDHSTTTAEAATSNGGTYGHGGDFLYRWGNPQSYDKGTEIDRILYGQHTPYIIPPGLNDAGKIMVFNNGSGRTPVFSEVLLIDPPTTAPGEYTYDNTNPFGPESPEIYYEEPDEFFSRILSSAFRLPNGNTLICEGAEGRFFELDESNTLVWEYFIPMNNVTGAITAQGDPRPATGNTTFRALKYGADYAAFAGRDLTPGDPIETNFNLGACATLSTESNETLQTSIYPNPVASTLTVQSSEQIDKIELYDVLGKKVASITGATAINMATFNSGIYILKVHSNNKVTSQKVIKN
jgi:hypothetical protein